MSAPVIYHGTPLSPVAALRAMAGRAFCVSFYRPDDIETVDEIGQSVMLDNGAYSFWKQARKSGCEADEATRDWSPYYAWAEQWLCGPSRWAVVPDAIAMPSQLNDGLLNDWPLGKHQAAPVYHMDEPISRLGRLLEQGWERVCIGWVGAFDPSIGDIRMEERAVGCPAFMRRLDEIDAEISDMPWAETHLLRGTAYARARPFQKRRQHQLGAERVALRQPGRHHARRTVARSAGLRGQTGGQA